MDNLKKFKFNFTSVFCFISLIVILGWFTFQGMQVYNRYKIDSNKNKTFASNIFVNGICLSGKSKDEAKNEILNSLNEDKKDKSFNIFCDGKKSTVYLKDLSFKNNIDEVLDYASNISKDKNYNNIFFSISLSDINLYIDEDLEIDSLNPVLDNLSLQFNDEMQECSVEIFNPNSSELFSYKEGKDGNEINKNELKEKIINKFENKDYSDIQVSRYYVKNNTTLDDIKNKTKLIGSFKTFLTNNYNRNKNVEVSMNAVNGTIINPGEIFSFNKIVGATTEGKGYLLSVALLNGQPIDSYGGGVCQSATTIYGAAIRSNMQIIERQSHSLKSSYVPVGLDSTISYDYIDLKFKNTSDYPVYIKAYRMNNDVCCEIYGAQPDWYDEIKVISGYIPGSSNKAYAKRLFYKNGKLVKEESLPGSSYKKRAKI